ncbi:hypothetical protein M409DRAFT_29186 [Zasmidium cellare ATCC 36951]|uniref:Zn(2)-C6 fungal-type domain-containing protein n=1 Tax=Zasmidium cellare ATCC 36951 TaxID=1080233 RepID=A0A6A6C4M9_ZASCE|nr:uncharacterized protein M409DRAFT_29186 [Zasmidium cellare ATCC 36951]KAF2160336.1 hypothetical protein M409DRAFT_29186 [Zasmidium cellare ATCC 36951]
MVAVTRRCMTCRGRKIKCDQNWPSCGQCVNSNRLCPGPPRKVKFMPIRTKTANENAPLLPKPNNDKPLPKKSARGTLKQASTELSVRLENDVTELQLAGDVFPCISSDPATLVAAELIGALQLDTQPETPSFLGSCCFIRDVPRMLGSSTALTATVACCLDACAKDTILPRSYRNLDPKLYGRALSAINEALQDSSQRTCVSTFLSVVLIGRLESLLVPRQLARIPCWSVHAAGISELLKYRGVFEPSDRTTFLAVLENFGPIISHSVFAEQDCFLASPEWQKALLSQPDEERDEFNQIYRKVFAQLAFLPNVIKVTRLCRKGEEDAFNRAIDLAVSMYGTLHEIGKGIESSVLSGLDVGPPSWIDIDAPMRTIYMQPGHDKSRVVSWHAVLTLIVNKVLMFLLESSTVDEHEKLESFSIDDLASQNRAISLRVWMLSDEARRKGLVEFYFYPGALSSTYDCTDSENERDWIVELLNEIMGGTWSNSKWSHDAVLSVCLTLAGALG